MKGNEFTDQNIEYIDWSDSGLERYESGKQSTKFADLSIYIDNSTGDLLIDLKKETKTKRDFTLIIRDPKGLLNFLEEQLSEE